jgi:hypothetical protein
MLRAVSPVERPRRACPVLTGWAGSFKRILLILHDFWVKNSS